MKSSKKLKLWCFSDTHTKHRELEKWLPEEDTCDVAVFAGDLSFRGELDKVEEFCKWLDQIQKDIFPYVVWIAGNHDLTFESDPEKVATLFPKNDNIFYLNDSGCEIEGFKFWGSPVQPWFHNWAFNRYLGPDITKHWNKIPDNTDVLITHGPVYKILDKTIRGDLVGCPDLRSAILDRIKPLAHICGHIHEAYGKEEYNDIQFVNACNCDLRYNLTQKPITIEVVK